jgi:hypothetical protein
MAPEDLLNLIDHRPFIMAESAWHRFKELSLGAGYPSVDEGNSNNLQDDLCFTTRKPNSSKSCSPLMLRL